MNKPPCEECEKLQDDPPCDECEVPLMYENINAVEIYGLVQNQVLLGPDGKVIDISIPAILSIARLYDCDVLAMVKRIHRVFWHFAEGQ